MPGITNVFHVHLLPKSPNGAKRIRSALKPFISFPDRPDIGPARSDLDLLEFLLLRGEWWNALWPRRDKDQLVSDADLQLLVDQLAEAATSGRIRIWAGRSVADQMTTAFLAWAFARLGASDTQVTLRPFKEPRIWWLSSEALEDPEEQPLPPACHNAWHAFVDPKPCAINAFARNLAGGDRKKAP